MASFQLEQLDTLLRRGSPSAAEYKAALERLHLELTTRESRSLPESRDFFVVASGALKRFKGTGSWDLRLRCLYLCWRFFFFHGDAGFALEAAEAHRFLAEKAESPAALRLSYNLLGMVHSDIGNIGEGLRCYIQGFEIAKTIDDARAQCSVLNNIGTALNYAGLYREAASCFQTVIAISQPHWNHRPDQYALSNLAQSYYYLEDLRSASDAIRQCIDHSADPTSPEGYCQRTIREYMYVQIAIGLGDLRLALQRLESCRQSAFAAGTDRCKTMAAIANARCEIISGKPENGLLALEEILLRSRALDSGYRDALIAIVKGYDDAELPESALRHMEALVEYERERRATGMQTLLSLPRFGEINAPALVLSNHAQTLEQKHAALRAKVAERQAAAFTSDMLERLAGTADLREDASGEHGFRVGRLSGLLASKIGWSEQRARDLEIASRLHDIGKIGIPDRVLGSSESLRDFERHFMTMHTSIGAELLARSAVPQLQVAEEIARYHHEHWDGSGYPENLSGIRIPIHARIVALADVFDALTHGRPFSAAWSIERATVEIGHRRGSQFEPRLTDAFLELIEELRNNHPNIDTFLSAAAARSPIFQIRKTIRDLLEQAQGQMEKTSVH